MIEQVFIQIEADGSFPNAALCAAHLGFRSRGRDVVGMTSRQIAQVEATPEHLVFGSVDVVRGYLARLSCVPPSFDYPSSLSPFIGRRVEVTTLGAIRQRYNEAGTPVFVKPVQHKLFSGLEVSRFRDLISTSSLNGETPVYCVEHVEFLSEWRVYCRDGVAVGIGHYRGDPLLAPSSDVVRRALAAFDEDPERPRACALDFGVTRDATLLVEVNDMFALGSYGIDPLLYSELIELRWGQLVGGS